MWFSHWTKQIHFEYIFYKSTSCCAAADENHSTCRSIYNGRGHLLCCGSTLWKQNQEASQTFL